MYLRPCEHRCVNLEGKRRCLCEEGFELQADGRSCKRTKSLCQLKELDKKNSDMSSIKLMIFYPMK